MKLKYTTIVAFLMLLSPVLNAQRSHYAGTVAFEQSSSQKEDGQVRMRATLNTQQLRMHKQQMITITPVLRSFDKANEVVFSPVVIEGKTRHKANKRAAKLQGYRMSPQPSQTMVYHKKHHDNIRFEMETTYQPWMRQAELVFIEDVNGCRNELIAENQYRVISPVLAEAYVPTYNIAYVEPPTEEVKQRSDSYTARLNFVVNGFQINRNYKNNAAVLDEVDKIVSEIKNDNNLTITELQVRGYASPEGSADGNMKLSEKRAKSFVNYINERHNIPQSAMQVSWYGDDWEGLRKLMENSTFESKGQVLDILNTTSDPQHRKTRLRNMPGYRALLDNYYPELRRNEYTVAYIAKPFSVEEAKTVIKTKPQLLSLNEMYLVANTYPKTSNEFKEVFDVAVRLYPEDPIANLNSAALDIEHGALDVALERSMKVDMPEAWNNIGYIYVQKQEYDQAAIYFKKAADAGSVVAAENLKELNLWLEDVR